MPPRNEKRLQRFLLTFFFFKQHLFFIAIRCSRLQSRNPGCWSLSSEISSLDLHYSTSKNRAFHGKNNHPQASVYQVAHFSAFFNEMPFTEPPLSPTSLPDSLKWKVIPKRVCLGTNNLLPFLKKVDARWWFFLDFRHELYNNKISWLVNLPTSEIADLVIRANWKPMEFALFSGRRCKTLIFLVFLRFANWWKMANRGEYIPWIGAFKAPGCGIVTCYWVGEKDQKGCQRLNTLW